MTANIAVLISISSSLRTVGEDGDGSSISTVCGLMLQSEDRRMKRKSWKEWKRADWTYGGHKEQKSAQTTMTSQIHY